MVAVRFPVSCEAAFDHLVDPRRRPEWQSSLARVEDVDGDPRAGQTWTDVTRPGLRPRMTTTEFERPHRWTEIGTWRRFSAALTLTFAPAPGGCDVTATVGIARPLAVPARWVVRADLRRAASRLQP